MNQLVLVLCDVVRLRLQEYERLPDARMRRRWRKRAEELLAKKYRWYSAQYTVLAVLGLYMLIMWSSGSRGTRR